MARKAKVEKFEYLHAQETINLLKGEKLHTELDEYAQDGWYVKYIDAYPVELTRGGLPSEIRYDIVFERPFVSVEEEVEE